MRPAPVRRQLWRGLCLVALSQLNGCAFDVAVAGGPALEKGSQDVNYAWSGEVRASVQAAGTVDTGIWILDHAVIGMELQGRAVQQRGSYYSAGGVVGLAFADARHTAIVDFDVGAPLGWSSPLHGYYVGTTSAFLWNLDARSDISASNRNFRTFHQRTLLGPMLRYRRHALEEDKIDGVGRLQHELLFGLQLRLLLTSDLL